MACECWKSPDYNGQHVIGCESYCYGCATYLARIKALEDTVEWAIDRLSRATVMSTSNYYHDAVIETLDELRRRAGMK